MSGVIPRTDVCAMRSFQTQDMSLGSSDPFLSTCVQPLGQRQTGFAVAKRHELILVRYASRVSDSSVFGNLATPSASTTARSVFRDKPHSHQHHVIIPSTYNARAATCSRTHDTPQSRLSETRLLHNELLHQVKSGDGKFQHVGLSICSLTGVQVYLLGGIFARHC